MRKKKIASALCISLLSMQGFAQEVVHQTYQVTITNNHFACLRAFKTEADFGSTKCELKLDRKIIRPGETAHGIFTTDAEIFCGIQWRTVGMINEKRTVIKQEVSITHNCMRKFCRDCEVQRTEQTLRIQQDRIQPS